MLLEIKHIETGYGKKPVLLDVSMEIHQGEIVAIIGPNGAGKSTVLKAACGLLPAWKGDIVLDGKRITGSTPAKNVSLGLTFCPQGNRVFHGLTVKENLQIGGFRLQKRELQARIDDSLSIFPKLKERLRQEAGTLSGGEQQMLALARALMPRPKVLLLDEPSLGLAPGLLDDVFETVSNINEKHGIAILIVEQKVRTVLGMSDRVYALRLGKIEYAGAAQDITKDHEQLKRIFL